ncbi:hypothetical protein FGO68_gene200 [Halteria grandinella]|uniref:Uncharacterized protein n=1 Tax=Halteria grandinella TaxID=5974 RepID=A0A8J8N944_HALGN|nr:hypothetical protein FGO68_gene200 [Halteria grandinella]
MQMSGQQFLPQQRRQISRTTQFFVMSTCSLPTWNTQVQITKRIWPPLQLTLKLSVGGRSLIPCRARFQKLVQASGGTSSLKTSTSTSLDCNETFSTSHQK